MSCMYEHEYALLDSIASKSVLVTHNNKNEHVLTAPTVIAFRPQIDISTTAIGLAILGLKFISYSRVEHVPWVLASRANSGRML